jgi:hypothetical protein
MRLRFNGVSKRPPDGFKSLLQFGKLLALQFAHGDLVMHSLESLVFFFWNKGIARRARLCNCPCSC